MVAHTLDPSTWEAETGGSLEFEASLLYSASFRTARAVQRNPVSNIKANSPISQVALYVLTWSSKHAGSYLTSKKGFDARPGDTSCLTIRWRRLCMGLKPVSFSWKATTELQLPSLLGTHPTTLLLLESKSGQFKPNMKTISGISLLLI